MNFIELLHSLPSDQVASLLKTLSYREREIVKLRTGFGDGYSYTLDEVGHIFKVTGQEISDIEKRAFEKLASTLGVNEQDSHTNLGSLNVYVDPGSASPDQISELLTEISTLYRMLGGSGVSFTMTSAKEPAIA